MDQHAAAAAPDAGDRAERVAVLFTDLVGSTALNTERGDEIALEGFRRHRRVVEEAATRHAGSVVKSTGDGLLTRFADPLDALACALDLRDGHDDGIDVAVRYGIDVGPATAETDDLFGQRVTAAARIVAKASAGQVLVSEDVRDAVVAGSRHAPGSDAEIAFRDLGLFWLKGFPQQWRLFEAVRSDSDPTVPSPFTHASPFVDRVDERTAIRALVDDVAAGTGAVVTIVGPKGTGKTRLAEEMALEAEARGQQIAVVHCHEVDRKAAMRPIASLFDRLNQSTTEDRFRQVLGDDASEVSRLLPHLRRRYADIAEPPELSPDSGRRRLFDSLVAVLARMSATRPVVLVLDDIAWLDETSSQFLAHLALRVDALHVLVLATYAPDELPAGQPVHRVLAALHRQRKASVVGVGTLDRSSVGELLSALYGDPPPDPVLDALFEATGGEVFFLEELLHHLEARGRLRSPEGQWLELDHTLGSDQPESLRLVVEQRLTALGEDTRELLGIVALVGRTCSLPLLTAVSDMDQARVLGALTDAEHAHAVRTTRAAGVTEVELVSDTGAAALVADMPLLRRQRLHLRIADALEAQSADALDEAAIEIGRHLEAAGRLAEPRRTAAMLRRAGHRALATYAFGDALVHLDRSMAVDRGLDGSTRGEVLAAMATAERSLGHYDEALALWSEAIDLYEEMGAGEEVARICMVAAGQVAVWRRGHEVRALIDRGLAALGGLDHPLAAGLLAVSGGLASQSADHHTGARLLHEAVDVASRAGDGQVLGIAEYQTAVHHFSICEYEQTVETGLRAIASLRGAGDLWQLANALGYVGTSLGWLGRFGEAAEFGAEAAELGRRLGNWPAYVFGEQAVAFGVLGRDPSPSALRQRGRDVFDLGAETGFAWLTTIGLARIGLADFWAGDWEQAAENFRSAVGTERRSASGGHAGRLFLLEAYLGRADEALDRIESQRGAFADPARPNTGTAWTLTATAIEAFLVLDRRESAAELRPGAVAHAATGCVMRSWDFRLVQTVAGIAAACDQDWDAALDHFGRARDQAASLPMTVEALDVERLGALALEGAPTAVVERFGADLEKASEGYRRLGMVRHRQLVGPGEARR